MTGTICVVNQGQDAVRSTVSVGGGVSRSEREGECLRVKERVSVRK